MSEKEKLQYIIDYESAEGIRLDHNIAHNPGIQALAKLMLNSM